MNAAIAVAEQFSTELVVPGGELHDFDPVDVLDEDVKADDLRFLERPSFLTESRLAAYQEDLATCVDLLGALPERRYGGSSVAMAEALGVAAPIVELIRAAEGLARPRFGRTDALVDERGLHVLEFNATSETGGLGWIDRVAQAWLDRPAAAKLLADRRAEYLSPTVLLADELRAFSVAQGGPDEPTVAIVEGAGGLALYGPTWHQLRGLLAEAGLRTLVCELPQMSVRNGRAFAGNVPVDVVYRVFELSQVTADPAGTTILLELIRLAHASRVAIWTSIESELLRNKSCLALLGSAELDRTEAETAAVRRLLPETTLIGGPPTEALIADLVRRRGELILKPAEGFAGAGIVAGWEVPEARWESAIRALTGPAVVQQRVLPLAEDVRGRDGEVRQVEAVYGLYYSPGRSYAGGGARSRTYGSAYITEGLDSPRSWLAPLFTVKEEPA